MARYQGAKRVAPIRAARLRLSSANSTHAERPALAVSPTAPHLSGMPRSRGSGTEHRKPSTVVSTTRTTA